MWIATYEWGTEHGVTTLFCAVDGTYGALGSTGGGVLGCSKSDTLGVHGVAFLDIAERALDHLPLVADVLPPTPPDVWQFIVATFDGLRAAPLEHSGTRDGHPLEGLWLVAQTFITEAGAELGRRQPPGEGGILLATDPFPPRPDSH